MVKLKSCLFASALAITSTATALIKPTPANAEIGGQFFCDTNTLTTQYQISSSEPSFTFIRYSDRFWEASGWTPARRCDHVSQKFEANRRNDTLNYFVPGRFNGYPVVCASSSPGSGVMNCPDSQVLFTLKSQQDFQSAIDHLVNLNTGITNDPYSTAPIAEPRRDGVRVLNVTKMLDSAYDFAVRTGELQSGTCTRGRLGGCR